MFIFNVKISKMKIVKTVLAIMAILSLSLAVVGIFRIFKSNSELEILEEDCMPSNEIAYLNDKNYANILKQVHENLDTYIGQKISYTGYVYRVPEIEDNQFILARDMRINDNTDQTVIVGFLCSLQNANDFETYSWIKITGTIEKGYYFGDIPCINISEIEKTTKPENCIIPKPDDNFIETSVIY